MEIHSEITEMMELMSKDTKTGIINFFSICLMAYKKR